MGATSARGVTIRAQDRLLTRLGAAWFGSRRAAGNRESAEADAIAQLQNEGWYPKSNICSNERDDGSMGKNARHGTDISRAAINEFITRPRPVSLSADELADDPVSDVADGQPVDVWLRFPEASVQERGVVVAYTDRARQVG